MQYAGEMTLKTFPSLDKFYPALVNLIGLLGSIYSIQIMRSYGRKQIILTGIVCSFLGLLLGYIIFLDYDFQDIYANSLLVRVILLLIMIDLRLAMSVAMGPVPWLYIA